MQPTSSRTTNPTASPTITTTSTSSSTIDGNDAFVLIDNNDIVITSLRLFDGNYSGEMLMFNPGFRIVFEASITVNVTRNETMRKFRKWYDDEFQSTDVNLTVNWKIYHKNGTLVDITDDDKVLEYFQVSFDNYKYNDVYSINSYFIVYPSQSVNIYDAESICTTFDTSYFKSGQEYTFEIEVLVAIYENLNSFEVEIIDTAKQASSLDLLANTPPINGSCSVSPDYGSALADVFTFNCSNWVDIDIDIDIDSEGNLRYNFIYEDSLFLKSNYDSISSVETILGFGNQTIKGVILDSFNLATCVEIIVEVDSNEYTSVIGDNVTSVSVNDFTEWLVTTYNDLMIADQTDFDDLNSTSNSSSDGETFVDIAQASLITDITYQTLDDFVDNYYYNQSNNLTDEEVLQLIDSQTDIIVYFLEVVEDYNNNDELTEVDAIQTLSVLSTTTDLVINTTDLDYNFQSSQNQNAYAAGVINSDIVAKILNTTYDTIIPLFSQENGPSISNGITYSSAENVLTVFDNVVTMRKYSNETNTSAILFGQTTIDATLKVSELLLDLSIPGESFEIETKLFNFEATKISTTTYQLCAPNTVTLSQEFVQIKANGSESNYLDCVVMLTESNLYQVNQKDNTNKFQSHFVLLDVLENERSANANNRRLSDHDTESQSYNDSESNWLGVCEPIIIILNHTNTSFWNFENTNHSASDNRSHFPVCTFFNESTNEFDDNGCYLLYYDEYVSYCACLHNRC